MKILITILSLFLVFVANAQKRDVDVGSFSELSLGIPANLFLKQGANESIEIDCDDEIFEDIQFELRGDRLVIKREGRGWNWNNGWRRSEVDIYVTMETVEALSVSGTGRIESRGNLKTEDLELAISGSGDMDLDIDSDDLETKISGSGSIVLAGNANDAAARISGSGKVKAEGLSVKTFEARISGSGSCYITVEEEIEASISGSGSVYYAGDPNHVISNSSGSGKVRKM